jgi:hypothetical protein
MEAQKHQKKNVNHSAEHEEVLRKVESKEILITLVEVQQLSDHGLFGGNNF